MSSALSDNLRGVLVSADEPLIGSIVGDVNNA
jgi:hypothetical protein